MTANQASHITNDTRAQVGIGTMIVFIAAILVAATAAAVLIDTSGKLQERSSSTGNEATKQVASNLVIVQVFGERDDASSNVTTLKYMVSLAPGASPVDLEQMRVQLSDGQQTKMFQWAATASATDFNTTFHRDHGATAPVMTAGDLAVVQLDLSTATGADLEVSARDIITSLLLPEVGNKVHADFTAPTSFGSDLVVVFR